MNLPDRPGPEKSEEEIEFIENPTGNVDWRVRIKRIARVTGDRITEVLGKVGRDYCCWCPPTKQDAGTCAVGCRRVCHDHALLCSVCGRPTCHRHRAILNGLAVCHLCYQPGRPHWILLVALILFGAIVVLGASPIILGGALVALLVLLVAWVVRKWA